jgi:hypothetical protein
MGFLRLRRSGSATRARRRQADPGPLATAELEAEEALGEHRQEDEASREHRLADRDRGKGERRAVQGERGYRDSKTTER